MSLADEFLAQATKPADAASAPVSSSLASQFLQQANTPAPPVQDTSEGFGSALLHQLGMFGRASVSGLTALPMAAADLSNGIVNKGIHLSNYFTGKDTPDTPSPSSYLQAGLDNVFGQPRNTEERLVQGATSAGMGLNPTFKLGQALAASPSFGARTLGQTLTAVPGNQAIAAATSGASSQGAQEAGLGPGMQMAAGIVGGVGGSLAGAAAGSAASGIRNSIVTPRSQPQLAPNAVESVMSKSPLPPSPERVADLSDQTARLLTANPGADPMAAARAADARKLGMNLTLGMVTRDPALYAQEQNWRGVQAGRPLLTKMSQLNGQLNQALEANAGSGNEPYQDGKTIISALSGIDDSLKSQVSSAYKAAEQSSGAKFDVPLQGISQDYATTLHNFGDKVPSGVRQNFEGLGLLSGTQKKVFGIDDAENLLKVINQNHTTDPASNAALTQLSQSVKQGILSADDQGGVFAGPRQLAAQRFQLHDNVPAFADASKNNIAPEDFTRNYLMNGDVDHVKGLVNLLQQYSPSTLKTVQGQIGNQFQQSAFGMNMGGDKVFSPERYAKALQNFGGTEKLNSVYGPETTDNLYTIGRTAANINSEPAFSPVNRSNTGSAVLDMASGIPMIGSAINAAVKRAMIARALEGKLTNTAVPENSQSTLNRSIMFNTARPVTNYQDQ